MYVRKLELRKMVALRVQPYFEVVERACVVRQEMLDPQSLEKSKPEERVTA